MSDEYGRDVTDEWIMSQLSEKTKEDLIKRVEKIEKIHLPHSTAKTAEERLAELRQNSVSLTEVGKNEGFKGPVLTNDIKVYDDGLEFVMESLYLPPFEKEKYVARLTCHKYNNEFIYQLQDGGE